MNKTQVLVTKPVHQLLDAKRSIIYSYTGTHLEWSQLIAYLLYLSEELPINKEILDKVVRKDTNENNV